MIFSVGLFILDLGNQIFEGFVTARNDSPGNSAVLGDLFGIGEFM